MKLLALFAVAAVADVATIIADIEAIMSATEDLTAKLSAYSGPTDAGIILVATEHVTDVVEQGEKDVNATQGPLSVPDAVSLTGPTTKLATAVSNSIDATIDKREAFESKGLGLEVEIQLKKIQSVSIPFSNALVALVPQSLQSTAQSLAEPIAKDLQRGVDAFANATGDYPSSASITGAAPALQILGLVAAAGLAYMIV